MKQTESIYTISDCNFRYCMPCIICDESVELTEEEEMSLKYGNHVRSKVCDKCKEVILYMREQMP
jgi:uncharacterized protein YlaI